MEWWCIFESCMIQYFKKLQWYTSMRNLVQTGAMQCLTSYSYVYSVLCIRVRVAASKKLQTFSYPAWLLCGVHHLISYRIQFLVQIIFILMRIQVLRVWKFKCYCIWELQKFYLCVVLWTLIENNWRWILTGANWIQFYRTVFLQHSEAGFTSCSFWWESCLLCHAIQIWISKGMTDILFLFENEQESGK